MKKYCKFKYEIFLHRAYSFDLSSTDFIVFKPSFIKQNILK